MAGELCPICNKKELKEPKIVGDFTQYVHTDGTHCDSKPMPGNPNKFESTPRSVIDRKLGKRR